MAQNQKNYPSVNCENLVPNWIGRRKNARNAGAISAIPKISEFRCKDSGFASTSELTESINSCFVNSKHEGSQYQPQRVGVRFYAREPGANAQWLIPKIKLDKPLDTRKHRMMSH